MPSDVDAINSDSCGPTRGRQSFASDLCLVFNFSNLSWGSKHSFSHLAVSNLTFSGTRVSSSHFKKDTGGSEGFVSSSRSIYHP